MTIQGSVVLTLGVCTPLSAQVVGAAYQVARSDQIDTRAARGLGLRVRFSVPIELRYDYLVAQGQRFDSPCGGFIPPGCDPETITYASHLHGIFVAARARLLSRGSFHVFVLPEVGLVSGTITKRSAATGEVGASASGSAPGAGAALELSASRVGGTPIGGWIAARLRGFVHPGAYALDAYDPHRSLNRIGSVELGVTFALQRGGQLRAALSRSARSRPLSSGSTTSVRSRCMGA